MRSSSDIVKGRITDYDPETGDVIIKARYDSWELFLRREYQDVLIQMVDSRPLSETQRRACYALIREIADWMGESEEGAKETLKQKFLDERYEALGNTTFSLSNAPMSLISEFQQMLIEICVECGVPTKKPLITHVDDIEVYIYKCLVQKKCCICGDRADLHHCHPIGMGANRKTMIHEGLEVLPLCRAHHTEMHQYTRNRFFEMYHIDKGIPADKVICRIYGLKMNQDEVD